MRISELIQQLEEIKKQYGDGHICVRDGGGEYEYADRVEVKEKGDDECDILIS
jgi:hypothetical protein